MRVSVRELLTPDRARVILDSPRTFGRRSDRDCSAPLADLTEAAAALKEHSSRGLGRDVR
jgi:hypothetical protein